MIGGCGGGGGEERGGWGEVGGGGGSRVVGGGASSSSDLSMKVPFHGWGACAPPPPHVQGPELEALEDAEEERGARGGLNRRRLKRAMRCEVTDGQSGGCRAAPLAPRGERRRDSRARCARLTLGRFRARPILPNDAPPPPHGGCGLALRAGRRRARGGGDPPPPPHGIPLRSSRAMARVAATSPPTSSRVPRGTQSTSRRAAASARCAAPGSSKQTSGEKRG